MSSINELNRASEDTLARNDVVGHTVKNILVSPWQTYFEPSEEFPDGYYGRSELVIMDSGNRFSLQLCSFEKLPDWFPKEESMVQWEHAEKFIGLKICNVLLDDAVPSLCLLLEDGTLLLSDVDFPCSEFTIRNFKFETAGCTFYNYWDSQSLDHQEQ